MGDAPQLLQAAGRILDTEHVEVAGPTSTQIDLIDQLLTEGFEEPPAALPLFDAGFEPDRYRWLTLVEAAGDADPTDSARRSAAAWTALAAVSHGAALAIGSDAAAVTSVALGLVPQAAGQWLSDQAPDLLWEAAPGYAARWARPRGVEAVLHPRPAPRSPVGPQQVAGSILGLSRLLSLRQPHWSVVLRLHPVAHAALRLAHRGVTGIEQQLGRRLSESTAVSRQSTQSTENRQVRTMLDQLDAWQQLVSGCAAEGAWECTVHAFARSSIDLDVVKAAVRSLLGRGTAGADDRPLAEWSDQPVAPEAAHPGYFGWLSSADLGALLVPPAEAIGSLQIRRPLPAGRRQRAMARPVWLGHWLGTDEPAGVDIDDLSGHVFVAGITGSGKSTTTARLLTSMWNDHGIPFLVIDPAKADYRAIAPHLRDGLRVVPGTELSMNVFAPWPGRPLTRHIAQVGNAFRGAFGMPVPVPYVAAMLFEQVAADSPDGRLTLHDAAARLDALVAELGYQGEIEGNIRASLGLRLRLLLQEQRAERVAGAGAPTWLVDRPTLVQLGDIGDDEERAFLAAMLVLYVADAARGRGENSSVRHVTVIEEAHRLMPEPRAVSGEEGDAGSVAARLMTQLLAEIRGYGEAVFVVDQSPAAVAREVVRNTTMKLAHRVVDIDDQRALGGAIGLTDDEVGVLGSLTPGRCLVSTRSLVRPQSVAVRGLDPAPERRDAIEFLPPPPVTRCHQPTDACRHHSSEARGRRAEFLVGLWAADGGHRDLVEMIQPLIGEFPSTRPSCLISVGIRRLTAGLRRIGQLAVEDAAAYEEALWRAAIHREAPPEHPGRHRRGPFAACGRCPSPCVVRATVGAGVVPRSAELRRLLAGAGSAGEVVRAAGEAFSDCADELEQLTSHRIAMAVGMCMATQATAAVGLDLSFNRALGDGKG